MFEEYENKIRGLNVVIGALEASSKDICINCIGLEGAKNTVIKRLKKLGMDIEANVSCAETKPKLLAKKDELAKLAEALKVADECSCQKTAGNCKMGSGCYVNSTIELLKLAEPAAPATEKT